MKDINKDCNNHRMEMIETNDYGYTELCSHCGKTYTYNSNGSNPLTSFLIVTSIIGAGIIWIIGSKSKDKQN